MSLKAGRVGVNPADIDPIDGRITGLASKPFVEGEIEQVYADNGVLGAKNLLKYPYEYGTQTLNGVTFTVNNDSSITINGTASSETYFKLYDGTSVAKGSYIFSKDISDSNITLLINAYNSGTYVKALVESDDVSAPVVIDYNGYNAIRIFILIKNGRSVSNKTTKPMLRFASDPDDTYAPYAMTNKELTEKKLDVSVLKSITADADDFSEFKTAIANL